MKSTIITGLILIAISTGYCQEQCLQKAWEAFNKKAWNSSIMEASSCTTQFGPRARKIQDDLISKGYKLPPDFFKPKYLSPEQKSEIFGHGLLNDVATSYWLIGVCNLQLNNIEYAKKAFIKAKELNLGLCYNPESDLFWSPSEESDLQLKELK